MAPFYWSQSNSHRRINLRYPWQPEYVPDHLQNLLNSSQVLNLPIPKILHKYTHHVLSDSASNRQTDKDWLKTVPPPTCGRGNNRTSDMMKFNKNKSNDEKDDDNDECDNNTDNDRL